MRLPTRLAPMLVFALAAAPLAARAQGDPLGGYVRQAMENNLSLRQERLSAERSSAAVREARGLLRPSVSFDARYSER
ncbi:MAG TPA: hypothetical protein VEY92_01475, partial [Pseudoxanthomonas sp.]|nr:hypothetical protein [Pseudoxanthomonas sp.]